jgi:hypothetical protein
MGVEVIGREGGDRLANRRVVAVGAGLLAALYLVFAYMQRPVPALFGVDQRPLAKSGGLRLKWLPPKYEDTRRLEQVLRGRSDGYVWRDGEVFEISVPGVPRDQVQSTANRIAGNEEGLAFREVVIVPEMQSVPGALEDAWGDDEGRRHADYYLLAPTRDELAATVATIPLPPGTHFAFERTEKGWRSYVVRDEAELDGWSVARATASTDPNTLRPLVLLDFDEEGTRRFGQLTSRIAGNKLAIMVRGEVRSAPVIMGPIRGGRASIAMGSLGTPRDQEREQQDLLDVLRLGALPAGGKLLEAHYVEPTLSVTRLWFARLAIGIGGGLLAASLVFLLLGWAKPMTRARQRFAGGLPWDRILVTLVAPAAIILVGKIEIYGAAPPAWGGKEITIGSLGITPFVTAAVIVELFAVLIPPWRARRHGGSDARMPITLVTAVVTIGLICLQAWFIARYLDAAEMIDHGYISYVRVIGSLAGGTMILLAAAAIVRWRGLGNGYGALYAFGFVLSLRDHWKAPIASGEQVLGGVALVGIALVFGIALRWRVAHRRIPSSSIAPLADAGGAIAIVALLSLLPIAETLQRAVDWSVYLRGHALPFVGLIVILTYAWSAAFARPVNDGWWRATVLSAVALAIVGCLVASTTHIVPGAAFLVDAMMIGVMTAWLLDAYADVQARRQKLVIAWTLHAPHFADAAEDALAAQGIPCHMASSHLRTLLSFFGPFVPIDVLVPVEHHAAASNLLATLDPTASPTASPATSSPAP